MKRVRALLWGIVFCLAGQAAAVAQPLASYRLGDGWATFGIALPAGAAPDAIRVGALSTQTDVKTRWPDGSIRFAIVTARAERSSTFAISAGPPHSGTFTPAWPAASVRFNIGGATYRADLPAFTGADAWLSGPNVREARVLVTPVAGSAHPLLQVIFDVRSYSDGAHRVDITVQNVKDTAAGNKVTYDVAVVLNGATVYQKAAVAHAYLTRWRKTFATTTLKEAEVVPDVATFVAAKAVPMFARTVANPNPPNVAGSKYDILTWGDMTPYMPAPGGRAEIGFYPYWTAQYLVHRTQGLREYMLKHADLSGSWSGHITESDGKTLISLDEYPNYWLDARSLGRPNGPATLTGITQGLENAHLPSLTYVPYLVTGDRYYLDQTKLWANFTMIITWPGNTTYPRESGRGILIGNEIRGIAWGMRAIAEAAVASPDGDPDKAYFATRVSANLEALDEYSKAPANQARFGPLEFIFPGKWAGPGDTPIVDGGLVRYPMWQFQYLAWALDFVGQMDAFGPYAHMRDRIARLWVRLFTSDPDYPKTYGAAGELYASVYRAATTSYEPVATMRQLFCQTFGCRNPNPPTPFVGYYGPEARAGLVLAERLQLPGASAARAWLEAQPGVMEDVNERSGFALAPPDEQTPRRPPPNVRIVR